jgi:hypothetical protein
MFVVRQKCSSYPRSLRALRSGGKQCAVVSEQPRQQTEGAPTASVGTDSDRRPVTARWPFTLTVPERRVSWTRCCRLNCALRTNAYSGSRMCLFDTLAIASKNESTATAESARAILRDFRVAASGAIVKSCRAITLRQAFRATTVANRRRSDEGAHPQSR